MGAEACFHHSVIHDLFGRREEGGGGTVSGIGADFFSLAFSICDSEFGARILDRGGSDFHLSLV